MARSITYWYDVIIAEKNNAPSLNTLQPNVDSAQTLLTDVTTTSKVARWRFWVWAVAACAYALDVVFDLALMEFEQLARRSRYATLAWYVQKAYEFQYGDSLVDQNNEFQYPVVNTANQIIKRAAAQEAGNIVNIKIAKLVGNIPAKLTVPEKAAATAYFEKIKAAGVELNIISDDPDDLRLYVKINFDPLVLDSTGQLLDNPGVYPAEDATVEFIKSVGFNGKFENCEYIDKLQSARGIESAYIIDTYGRYGANPFVSFAERYYPNAGHMRIDLAAPLQSTFTYAANV